jgi:hypothetical protein
MGYGEWCGIASLAPFRNADRIDPYCVMVSAADRQASGFPRMNTSGQISYLPEAFLQEEFAGSSASSA